MRVFVPSSPKPPGGWPILLFLHGIGERGSDGIAPTTVGIGPAVQREPERFPFVIVFPQCPAGELWRGAVADAAMAALDATMEQVGADASRVYLSGLSMGGYGSFHLAVREPDRFAAVVPICGGLGRADARAVERIAHLPMWVFHGAEDDVVLVSESRAAVAALRAAGAKNIRYTEYPRVRHNSWDRAYAEKDLVPWILAQQKPAPR